MVEFIKKLRTELRLELLFDRNILEYAQVHLLERWPDQIVATLITPGATLFPIVSFTSIVACSFT